MLNEAEGWLESEGVAPAERSSRRHIDARYEGQNFEVQVPIVCAEFALEDFLCEFAAAHEREYGYAIPGRPVEIVNCRLQAIGAVPKAPLERIAAGSGAAAALTGRRSVYCGREPGWVDAPVYARNGLGAGDVLASPAVIEEMSSTLVLVPPWRARVDAFGNLIVELREGR
jgi:N-methylhydantoinase A